MRQNGPKKKKGLSANKRGRETRKKVRVPPSWTVKEKRKGGNRT